MDCLANVRIDTLPSLVQSSCVACSLFGHWTVRVIMADTVALMTVEVAEQGSADLLSLMESAEVGIIVQHTVIVTHGFKTVWLVSGLGEDREGVQVLSLIHI